MSDLILPSHLKKELEPMKMVYMASPFSISDKDENRVEKEHKRFIEVTMIISKLIEKYRVSPIAPITQSYMFRILSNNPNMGGDFDFWKDIDLCAIDHCEEVWVIMMSGWKLSKGVTAEIEHAKQTNKPVKYINPETLDFETDSRIITRR